MNITTKSTKDEILTEAQALISDLDESADELRRQRNALAIVLGIIFLWLSIS